MSDFFSFVNPIIKFENRLILKPSALIILFLAFSYLNYFFLAQNKGFFIATAFFGFILTIILSKRTALLAVVFLIILSSHYSIIFDSAKLSKISKIDRIEAEVFKTFPNQVLLSALRVNAAEKYFELSQAALIIPKKQALFFRNLRVGQKLTITNLNVIKNQAPANNGLQSVVDYLAIAQLEFSRNTLISYQASNPPGEQQALSNQINNFFNFYLNQPGRGIAKAMLLGDRSDFTSASRLHFLDLGIFHLISISGLHLGQIFLIVLFILTIILKPFPLRQSHIIDRVKWILALVICFFYLNLILFPIPATRALVFLALFFVADSFYYYLPISTKILITASIFILINPAMVGNVSFNLSFLAVFILSTIFRIYYRIVKRSPFSNWGIKIVNNFSAIFLVSFILGLVTAPLILFIFGNINLTMPINNVIHITISTMAVIPALILSLPLVIFYNLFGHGYFILELYFKFLNFLLSIWYSVIKVNYDLAAKFIITQPLALSGLMIFIWAALLVLLLIVLEFYIVKKSKFYNDL